MVAEPIPAIDPYARFLPEPVPLQYRIASYVDQATHEKQNREAVEEHEREHEDYLREVLHRGLTPWHEWSVSERRRIFADNTDMADVPLLLADPASLIDAVRKGRVTIVSPWWGLVMYPQLDRPAFRDFVVKWILKFFRPDLEALLADLEAFREAQLGGIA